MLFVAIPLLIYAARKPHWKTAEGAADFEPFGWEAEGRHPSRGAEAGGCGDRPGRLSRRGGARVMAIDVDEVIAAAVDGGATRSFAHALRGRQRELHPVSGRPVPSDAGGRWRW
ncbi:MAG: hypothetical protein MZV65_31195 [Chromatiales bacterium]|nr:hypothetical protein [Chromatiales bacterium]